MADHDRRFLYLFALANAGGVVAYAPFLTLIFPEKVSSLAGDARIEWLATATFAGAITASIGNIAFGWASDVFGTRRGWAVAGMVLTLASYVALHFATTQTSVVVAIIAYQLVLNMMLASITAWAADIVPDSQKGYLGGLLALGPPTGALAGVAATLPGMSVQWLQLAVICILISICVAPLLMVAAPHRPRDVRLPQRTVKLRIDFGLIWVARLLVQIAGALLFSFLLYYFQSLDVPESQSHVALLNAVTLACAVPIALGFGKLSDRLGPRKPVLIVSTLFAAAGLGLMAFQHSTQQAVMGYGLFGCATAVYLALHSAYSMQLLPSPHRRGRDLGFLNLTNTLPSIVAPLLAIWLIPRQGFGLPLALLAGLLVLSALLVASVRSDSQAANGREI
jgi:MFS family permease